MAENNNEQLMEPIAIVGMGMRFPGESHSSDSFWDLLKKGRDGWRTMPKHRFNLDGYYHPDGARAGSVFVKGSHFLSGEYEKSAKQFDAPFFNITASEVEGSDPQHLHMLEVSYEALENAGIPMQSVIGSDTSVYVGCFTRDWEAKGGRDPYTGPFYAATGNGMSMLANRVSWFYDMRGPSMTVDTACSSSLYAVHLACQSLRTGEAKMAIAGGTNIICDPCYMRDLTTMGFLSPDGRCHSFDHRANGYGRGDGIGAVVLKTMSQALKDGDTIRAVIRNTGLGQDGRTPGITMPSPEAQADLIRLVYKNAGLTMDQTAYFEAHGTGTPIGDPYELSALGNTFGKTRDSTNPLYVGSVKANIGHLEGGAGIAGLIKAALVVERGEIPPLADFEKVNPRLKLDEWKVALPLELTPWPVSGVRRASVNCFGYGGANSHVIIDDAYHYLQEHGLKGHHQTVLGPTDVPEVSDGSDSGFSSAGPSTPGDDTDKELSRPLLMVLSSVDQAGLQRTAAALTDFLAQQADHEAQKKQLELASPGVDMESFLPDLAYTLSHRRSTFDHRTFVVARSASELQTQLSAPLSKLRRTAKNSNLFFVFTGQGAQWATMGKALLAFDTYRNSLKRAQAQLARLGCPWDLIRELSADKEQSRIDQPDFSQPLCTALQLALVDLLEEWNLRPKSVVGHSSGEIAASYAAGFLTHEQAVKVAYCRGLFSADVNRRLGDKRGAMMAVGLSEADVKPYLDQVPAESVVVACVNSPNSVTLSGDETSITVLEKTLQDASVFARKLRVKTAYHSPHMRVIADDYLAAMDDIQQSTEPPKATMFSSVTGGTVLSASDVDASYWVKNMLGCVRFSDAVQALLTQPANPNAKGRRRAPIVYSGMVEIGPAEALKGPLLQILNATDGRLASSLPYTALLSRNVDGGQSALAAAGKLWASGLPIDLHRLNFPTEPEQPLQSLACLPPYKWNHKVYEHESTYGKTVLRRAKPRTDLLGFVDDTADEREPRWHNYIRLSEQPWLGDHRVQNMVLYPGAAMVVQAIEAARTLQTATRTLKAVEVRDIAFKKGLVIPAGDAAAETAIHLKPEHVPSENETAWSFSVFSKTGEDPWAEMCTGSVSLLYHGEDYGEGSRQWAAESTLYDDIRKRACRVVKSATFYKLFDDKMNLQYGPLHRNVTEATAGFGEGYGTVTIPDTKTVMPSQFEYPHLIHPATLDSIFHMQALGYLHSLSGDESLVPISIDKIYVAANAPTEAGAALKGFSKGTQSTTGDTVGDIVLSDDTWQEPKVIVRGFLSRDISAAAPSTSGTIDNSPRKCTRLDYVPLHPEESSASSAQSDYGVELASPGPKLDQLIVLHASTESLDVPLVVAEISARLAATCGQVVQMHPEQVTFGEQSNVKDKTVLSLLEAEESFVDGWTEKQFTWLRDLASTAETILWVTRGADVSSPETLKFSSTTGLLRTIRVEKPQLRLFQLDLDTSSALYSDNSIDMIVDAFETSVLSTARAAEQEMVQIGDKLHVPRLVTDDSFHAELKSGAANSTPVQQALDTLPYPVRAVVSQGGRSLCFVKDEQYVADLADDEVEVAPSVTMLDSAAFESGDSLGRDAVGTVTAIGAAVKDYAVGDKVLVCAASSLRTRLRVKTSFVRKQPGFIGDAVAVTLPTALTLAWLSLLELGFLKTGESVLIAAEPDAATGAMIYLAQHLGAKVYASFTTPYHHRWLVEQLGLEEDQVIKADRGDNFKEALFRRNKGNGVDVVVTSVAGDIAHQSLNVLAPFGRCVSLGSNQTFSSTAQLAFGVSIHNLDFEHLRAAAPQRVANAYQSAWSLAQQGVFHTLPPKKSLDLSDFVVQTNLPDAVKAPGGVAVTIDPASTVWTLPPPPAILDLDPEATYVLAGGLGGIGRSIAETMFAAGARKITFISRSGAKTEEAKKLLSSLQQRGCAAKAYPVDVSSPGAVEAFVQASIERGDIIKGVVQAAMVLQDSVFDNMTFEQWTRCTQPKIQGSWNLHQFFPKDMDFFIMLSSMAGIIGNPGQANYSAAGTYQDALSVHRRKQGLASTTIDLGIVSDVGYIAENPEQFERLRYLKPLFISERDLRLLLSAAMLGKTMDGKEVPPQVVTGVGKELMQDGSIGSAMAADLKYSSLHGSSGNDAGDAGEDEAAQEALKTAGTLQAATEFVEAVFAANIAKATGMEPEDVDLDRPMHAYGVDSLAAVEVRNMIFRKFKSDVSVFDLLSTLPLHKLAIRVVAKSKLVKNEVQTVAQEENAE